ncbi:MAG: hypothetical protein ACYC7E_23145 [Armatimonadota bacterium]
MGLSKAAASVLMLDGRRERFAGRVLTLGKQDIYVTAARLQALAQQFGYPLAAVEPATLHPKAELAAQGYLADTTFFTALGFTECRSLDFADFEGADILFDLNSPTVPDELLESCDVIIDGGTLEHVFHLPNALANLFRLLKKSGRIIHLSPSSNHLDHGFYMFSPTFFYDYYSVNRFTINTFQLFRYTPRPNTDPWLFYDYVPGCLSATAMFGGLDDGMYGVYCVATKTAESTGHVVPIQGYYASIVSRREAGSAAADDHIGTAPPPGRLKGFIEAIRPFPFLYYPLRLAFRALTGVKRIVTGSLRWRKKGLGLRIAGRY